MKTNKNILIIAIVFILFLNINLIFAEYYPCLPSDKPLIYDCNPNSIIGDADGNGVIEANDYIVVGKLGVGCMDNLPTNICCMDITRNGHISALDCSMIMGMVKGVEQLKGKCHCIDGVKNLDEDGIDCGGIDCSPCPPVLASCGVGGCTGTEDCNNCPADCGACPPVAPTCNDWILNQGEEDIDCGGPCPACLIFTSYFDDDEYGVKLSFFNWINLLSVVTLIAIIYIINVKRVKIYKQ